jgi:hypothetical protein
MDAYLTNACMLCVESLSLLLIHAHIKLSKNCNAPSKYAMKISGMQNAGASGVDHSK